MNTHDDLGDSLKITKTEGRQLNAPGTSSPVNAMPEVIMLFHRSGSMPMNTSAHME